MHYLYILRSTVKSWHYIGSTSDIENRLAEHNAGEVKSTKAYRPLLLAHQEEFLFKTDARKREIFLKKNSKARRDLLAKLAPIV